MINLKLLIILTFLFCSTQAFAQLKVYKNDGTTVLGKSARCMVPPCAITGVGWGYSNAATGDMVILTDASFVYNYATFFFSAVDCGGSPFMYVGNIAGVFTDGVSFMYTNGTAYGGACRSSERAYGGACVNTGSTCGWNYNSASNVGTPQCGATVGSCKIK